MYLIVAATSKNWHFYLLHAYYLEPGGQSILRSLWLWLKTWPWTGLPVRTFPFNLVFSFKSPLYCSLKLMSPRHFCSLSGCFFFFLKHFWFLLPNLSLSQHSAAFRESFICRDSLQSVKALVLATAHCTCLHKLNGFYRCFWSSHHSKE